MKKARKTVSNEYIRGLTDGEGCFTFCSVPRKLPDGTIIKMQLPAFVLSLHERDLELVKAIKEHLDIKNKIYHIRPYKRDSFNRGATVRIMIRDIGTIKNVIVPLFSNKLVGYKAIQFEEWMKRIGSDPTVPENYKLICRLWKNGYYDKG